jgi:hypothetical protein
MNLFNPTNRMFELARQAKRLPHLLLATVLTPAFMLIGALLGGLPLQWGLMALFPDGRNSLADQPFISGLVMALVLVSVFGMIFVLLWVWLKWFEKRPFWTLGFERAGALVKYGRGMAVGFGMFVATIGLSAALGYIAPETFNPQRERWAALGGVLIVLVGWAVQGAAEETVVRGWLMPVVGARYRPWIGVLVSSLLFAGLHGLNPNIGLLPLINLFLFGLFGALYALWEGGLWGIAAQHAVWNWTQGNIFGLEVSGGTGGPILFNLHEVGPDVITGGPFGPEGGLALTAVLVIAIAVLVGLQVRKTVAALAGGS